MEIELKEHKRLDGAHRIHRADAQNAKQRAVPVMIPWEEEGCHPDGEHLSDPGCPSPKITTGAERWKVPVTSMIVVESGLCGERAPWLFWQWAAFGDDRKGN